MAGFDKSLDKELFSEGVEFDRSRITISVFSYNEGTPKLQITRELKNSEGVYSWTKLGRLTGDEVNTILPVIDKAKVHL